MLSTVTNKQTFFWESIYKLLYLTYAPDGLPLETDFLDTWFKIIDNFFYKSYNRKDKHNDNLQSPKLYY